MNTLLRLTVANIRSLVRDRAALFWTFFFPVMFVFLFGWIFGGSSDSKVAIGFVDQDNTQVSMGLQQSFSQVTLLTIQTGSLEAEKAAMQHGDISAIVVVPSGTGAAVAAKSATSIQLYIDPSSSQVSQVVEQDSRPDSQPLQPTAGGWVVGCRDPADDPAIDQHQHRRVPGSEHPGHGPDAAGCLRRHPAGSAAREGHPQAHRRTPLARWKLVGSNVLLRLSWP